jgi:DNA-binding MarR family transcriptional regulator
VDTYALDNSLSKVSDLIDTELQIQTLRCFLFVAHRGSCTQKDVENALKLSNASASRNISYWTDRRFDRKEGKGFIMRVDDPQDRRFRVLTLTKKGRDFFNLLRQEHINGETTG